MIPEGQRISNLLGFCRFVGPTYVPVAVDQQGETRTMMCVEQTTTPPKLGKLKM